MLACHSSAGLAALWGTEYKQFLRLMRGAEGMLRAAVAIAEAKRRELLVGPVQPEEVAVPAVAPRRKRRKRGKRTGGQKAAIVAGHCVEEENRSHVSPAGMEVDPAGDHPPDAEQVSSSVQTATGGGGGRETLVPPPASALAADEPSLRAASKKQRVKKASPKPSVGPCLPMDAGAPKPRVVCQGLARGAIWFHHCQLEWKLPWLLNLET